MVQSFPLSGRTHYGPASPRQRHNDGGNPSSDTACRESLRGLPKRHGVNPETVAKWKQRSSVSDLRTGPQEPRSTVLSPEHEAIVVAFRRHTLLPLERNPSDWIGMFLPEAAAI